ncbi:MAG: hypothetical protein IIV85_05120 [Clostridia bacterium]|nr:hypothetical protein [Clostridia bacterium]MBQ5761122.1 hypothetical protein [Clostridia bacterium]
MNTMTGILAICALLILWEISAISFTNKKIIVKGEIPSQKLGIGLFAVVCIIIMGVNWGFGMWSLITMAAVVVAALLNFAMKNGLSEYGMYINGWSTPYKEMKYYDYERREGELNRVRVNSTKRDVTLMFTDDQINLALAYFDKYKVYDMETYKMLKKQEEMRNSR